MQKKCRHYNVCIGIELNNLVIRPATSMGTNLSPYSADPPYVLTHGNSINNHKNLLRSESARLELEETALAYEATIPHNQTSYGKTMLDSYRQCKAGLNHRHFKKTALSYCLEPFFFGLSPDIMALVAIIGDLHLGHMFG